MKEKRGKDGRSETRVRSAGTTTDRLQRQDPDPLTELHRHSGNQAIQRYVESRTLQRTTTVSRPDDKFETEAELVAETVMRTTDASTVGRETGVRSPPGVDVQTNATTGETTPELTVSGPSDRYGWNAEGVAAELTPVPISSRSSPSLAIARRSIPPHDEGMDPVRDELDASGGGRPLSDSSRAFFEPRFGVEFGDVRLHTGDRARRLSERLGATAFTHGTDIYFGDGAYRPRTGPGRKLIAHELAHVIQQTGPTSRGRPSGGTVQRQESPVTAPTGPEMLQSLPRSAEETGWALFSSLNKTGGSAASFVLGLKGLISGLESGDYFGAVKSGAEGVTGAVELGTTVVEMGAKSMTTGSQSMRILGAVNKIKAGMSVLGLVTLPADVFLTLGTPYMEIEAEKKQEGGERGYSFTLMALCMGKGLDGILRKLQRSYRYGGGRTAAGRRGYQEGIRDGIRRAIETYSELGEEQPRNLVYAVGSKMNRHELYLLSTAHSDWEIVQVWAIAFSRMQ